MTPKKKIPQSSQPMESKLDHRGSSHKADPVWFWAPKTLTNYTGGDVHIHGFGIFAYDGMVDGGVLVEEGFGLVRCGKEYPHCFRCL